MLKCYENFLPELTNIMRNGRMITMPNNNKYKEWTEKLYELVE